MSNNKQSSVQQFWDKIALKLTIDQLNEFMPLLEQAKAMHKNEIIESWHNGYNNQSPMIDEENCGEQYFKETFGSPR